MDTTLVISILALVATFYQLHLQRVHNEKSLKPLIQIDLTDKANLLFVRISNNGVGPITIERLIFEKGKETFSRLEDCVKLDPKVYDHYEINTENKKVLTPGGYLDVCHKEINLNEDNTILVNLRTQLALLTITAQGHDIYGNTMTAKQNLKWFARHNIIAIE